MQATSPTTVWQVIFGVLIFVENQRKPSELIFMADTGHTATIFLAHTHFRDCQVNHKNTYQNRAL